jgi:hypothetical protein
MDLARCGWNAPLVRHFGGSGCDFVSKLKRTAKVEEWIEGWIERREYPWFWHITVVRAAERDLGVRQSDVDRVLDRLKKTGRIYPNPLFKRGMFGIREREAGQS